MTVTSAILLIVVGLAGMIGGIWLLLRSIRKTLLDIQKEIK